MANLFFKRPITVPSIFHIPDKSMIMNYFSMLFIALSNNCLIFAMPYRQCRRAASKTMKNKAVMTEHHFSIGNMGDAYTPWSCAYFVVEEFPQFPSLFWCYNNPQQVC